MDLTLLTFFNQTLAHPLLDYLMMGLTMGGLGLLPGLGIMLLRGNQWRIGLAILISLAASLIITLLFQYLALRPRPEAVQLLLPTPNFPSYPSGHASGAFSTAVILILAYRQWRWQTAALIGASLIALSRVYLGHHYFSDIVGGAVLGAGVGATGYGWLVAHSAGQSGWRWLLWLQVAIMAVITQMAYLNILPWSLLHWPLADKVLHFLLFGGVVFWLNLWLEGRQLSVGRWRIPLAILIPFSIALIEESIQHFSPVRTAGLDDLLSDLAGMICFWWLSHQIIKPKLPKLAASSRIAERET